VGAVLSVSDRDLVFQDSNLVPGWGFAPATLAMTPSEKNIVRSLVAVAWVDGKLESGESSVIEGLLSGFDASEAEEQEILEYARTRRTLENDIPLADLSPGDRELLLSNAALLTHADGKQSPNEKAILKKLAHILGFSRDEANDILASVSDGALRLSERVLEPDER
jgi:tellurite resistance protein